MMTAIGSMLAALSPLGLVATLLLYAEWRDRRRAAAVARQIRLADAIIAELGGVVAPVVSKPLGRPWRIAMSAPVARPGLVSRVVAIAHHTLGELGVARYELVLTPQPAPLPPGRSPSAGGR
jgi:hypothetical protein